MVKRTVFALMLLFGFLAAEADGIFAQASTFSADPLVEGAIVPGEVLVGFYRDQIRPSMLLDGLQVEATEPLDLRGLHGDESRREVAGLVVQVAVGEEWHTIEQLQSEPAVAFAEPNWIVSASRAAAPAQHESALLVNDPLYDEQQWYLQRMGAARAWQLARQQEALGTPLSEMRIAVVDTGIDYSHPEFAGRIVGGVNYISPGLAPQDDNGHGTFIAGLIGAGIDDGLGLAGMAPKVVIDPRKALDSQALGTITGISDAIRGAADAGADIINLSLEAANPSVALEAATNYAAAQGALLIASAGNILLGTDPNDTKVLWPAAYPSVLAVAGTDYYDQRGAYSRFGDQIEVAASGGDSAIRIFGTWAGGIAATRCNSGYQVIDGGSYCYANGTSMAAGLASGVAALIWSMRPDLTATEVRALLRDTAKPLNLDPVYVGAGRVDAHFAARYALTSHLDVSPSGPLTVGFETGATLISVTTTFTNPSLEPIQWQAHIADDTPWLFFDDDDKTASGNTRYGQPDYETFTISPTHLATGSYASSIAITGTRADNSQTVRSLAVVVNVSPPQTDRLYAPLLVGAPPSGANFRWEVPQNGERDVLVLTDNSNSGLNLPFPFPLKGESFTSARIYSDGFVAFPAAESSAGLPNRCMANLIAPHNAIYAWWADLDPRALDSSRISTFQPAADQFVVEFLDVPSAASQPDEYRVSFQITLHSNGDIDLNYQKAPTFEGAPPDYTVGVESTDGRFHNQIACADGTSTFGEPPTSSQSLAIKAEEIY